MHEHTTHRPVTKPILTYVQKARRVRYALKYHEWDDAEMLDVLWSDEAMFTVIEGRSGNMYRKRGSDSLDPCYLCGTTKQFIMVWVWVWGCFSGRGLGKLVLPASVSINQYVYYELLNDLWPSALIYT